ncbi:MAG: ABC transporter substrate-binding protein [Deltaproteobacteria bacterium]|nr:ABC transporter substrate-binding protein [Deltaproteobacteria bacterium]
MFLHATNSFKRTVVFFVLAVASLFRLAYGADTASLRVSYGGTAGYQLPLWVNKEAGIHKKYGIDLEILLIGGGSANLQALLGGSLHMTQTAASAAIQASSRGAPTVIVATSDNKIPFQMISRPEIKDPQQLRGKKIGIVRFGGSNDTAVRMALKTWKIDPREVTIIQSGGTAARMAALMSGGIDATVQSYPEIFQARKLGMNVLADIGDFGAYTNTSLIMTRPYLQQNRTLTKNMIKAQIEAIHYIKTNKAGTINVLRRYLRVGDAETIAATYDFFSQRMPRVPRAELEGVKNILEELGVPHKDIAEFTDFTLLNEIEREGFIQKLYGK